MSIIAAISNIQTSFPEEVIFQGGAFATISLIISLIITLLVSDSRYWDRWTSSTLDACYIPLLLTFAAIAVYKIMLML